MRLLEPAHLLDVVHEVPSIHILHDKVQAVLETDSKVKVSTLQVLRSLGRAGDNWSLPSKPPGLSHMSPLDGIGDHSRITFVPVEVLEQA